LGGDGVDGSLEVDFGGHVTLERDDVSVFLMGRLVGSNGGRGYRGLMELIDEVAVRPRERW